MWRSRPYTGSATSWWCHEVARSIVAPPLGGALVGVGGVVHESRRRRLDRNAAGLVMWSGQFHPRVRMSVSRASVMARADQTAGSMPAAVSASQMPPMWPRPRPWVRATSWAASRWVANGRGVVRQRRGGAGFCSRSSVACARARTLGELLPTGAKRPSPPDGGRWKLCTG